MSPDSGNPDTGVDPLAEVVGLLQPRAPFAKVMSARGPWRVHRSVPDQLFYCLILEGSSRLVAAGEPPLVLEKGDFVLVPSSYDFTASSVVPPEGDADTRPPVNIGNGEHRHGEVEGEPDVRMLLGHCVFGSPDASLLVSLLPKWIRVRGEKRLGMLAELVGEESRGRRPAREVILARLLEVLLIEALRSSEGVANSPGLLRGLADERLAVAIRGIHADPTKGWTIAQLAKESGLSRTTFFERFARAVGVAPMEYLLGWRMALAKEMLRKGGVSVAEVAGKVGYSSASTFSVAFSRHVGRPPRGYTRSPATV